MKKVTNITLGGIVFAVEEDAYTKLSAYLAGIERTFKKNDDYAEIAADIESAIAEKFLRAKKNEKRAVSVEDVERVMSEMGHAEDLAEESGTSTEEVPEETIETEKEPVRRLYRDTDDAILAGVCSGIASYFAIDPVIVRIAFVVLAFLNGIGILLYILLWLIVPAATTPAEKYAMRGEHMTISHITARVKKKINDIETPDLRAAKGAWGGIRSVLEKIFQVLGKIIMAGIHVLRYVMGFAFVLAGSLGIAGLLSGMSVVWFGNYQWPVPELGMAMNVIQSVTAGHVFVYALFVATFIPLVVMILIGSCLFAGRNIFTLTKALTLFVTWIVAVGIMGSLAALYGAAFVQEMRVIEEWHDAQRAQEVIYISY